VRTGSALSLEELLNLSRLAGADELPDLPDAAGNLNWFYPPGGFESGALARVVRDGKGTNHFVDYAPNFGGPVTSAHFVTLWNGAESGLEIHTTGRTVVTVDGRVVSRTDSEGVIALPRARLGALVEVDVLSENGNPAAIGVPAEFSASWSASTESGKTVVLAPRRGGEVPAHECGEPEVDLVLVDIGGGVFALPQPVLGYVLVESHGSPSIVVGESLDEALADPALGESNLELEREAPGLFVSRHRLGFRFVRVLDDSVVSVRARASVRPAPRRGAFVSDDATLNSIWAASALTLRSCMQTFLLDGIKRDRMPWIGDHALGILTNAFAFGDVDVARNTLTALGRPRHGYINGIADYSLWWVISHGLHQLYFDDATLLGQEADHIDAFLTDLSGHADADGIFRPSNLPDAFEQAGPGSLFLDWGVSLRGDQVSTAIQILWFWALSSGATVLAKAGHGRAEIWQQRSDLLRRTLTLRGWDEDTRIWREYLDVDGEATAYPNFLAVLAGLMPADGDNAAVAAIMGGATGTPFMRAFALRGLGAMGHRSEAVAEVRHMWGRMLEAGTVTFWEEFDEVSASPWEMYGRPFGKSLCHAWSAGPAALLPELILGLRPLADGWREFTVDPALGRLEWAGAVVPAPPGDIVVQVRGTQMLVEVPAGSSLIRNGRRHVGPVIVEEDLQ
jgi:hypothetical protein